MTNAEPEQDTVVNHLAILFCYFDRRVAGELNYPGRRRTLPAAISRSAVTISRLSVRRSGFAPFKSCFALFDARITSSNRLEMFPRQSSTVTRAINIPPQSYDPSDYYCYARARTASFFSPSFVEKNAISPPLTLAGSGCSLFRMIRKDELPSCRNCRHWELPPLKSHRRRANRSRMRCRRWLNVSL
jgi:hypothetical protein